MRFVPGDYVRIVNSKADVFIGTVGKIERFSKLADHDYQIKTASPQGNIVRPSVNDADLVPATEAEYRIFKYANSKVHNEIVQICLRKKQHIPPQEALSPHNWSKTSHQQWEVEEGNKTRDVYTCKTGTGDAVAFVFSINGLITDIAVRYYDEH